MSSFLGGQERVLLSGATSAKEGRLSGRTLASPPPAFPTYRLA